MKKIIIFIMMLPFLVTSAIAGPEWVNKPIQCGSVNEVDEIIYTLGEEFLLRGVATIYDQELQPKLGIIGVYVNAETGTFTIIEVFAGATEACIISFGNNLKFDLDDYILEMPEPNKHPRGIDKMKIPS